MRWRWREVCNGSAPGATRERSTLAAGTYQGGPNLRHRFEPDELVAHAQGVRALARSLVLDASTADDVVQEACLAALTRPPVAGTPRRAWFVGVVRNLSRRTYRDASRRERRERAASRPEANSPAAQVDEEIEAHRRLVAAVAGLADPYRTAVVLRYFDGLAVREIADRHGVPPGTVSTWLHRGLAMLRTRLVEDDEDWRAALVPLLAFPRRPIVPLAPVAGAFAMKKALGIVVVALLLLAVGSGIQWLTTPTSPRPEDHGETASVPPVHPPRTRAEAPAVELAPPPVDLAAVDRDLDLHGVVVDGSDRPVAAARVETVTTPWQRTRMLHPDWAETVKGASTVSSADGTFSMHLRRGALVHLRASKDGVGTGEIPACQAGERVRVVLRPGVTVAVTTVDGRGSPVPGTVLRLNPWGTQIRLPERAGTTDKRGEFRFVGLPPGETVTIEATPPLLAPSPWNRIGLPAEGEVPLRIVLGEGRVLRGRVTDAASGIPIANAAVGLGWTMRQRAASDAAGRYELPGCGRQGYFDLVCLAPGYASGHAVIGPDDAIDFALTRGDRAEGHLVGADGSPVAAARYSVVGRDTGTAREAARTGVSAADGRFAVEGLAHDQPHALIVVAEGHGRIVLEFDPPADLGGTRDLGAVVLPVARSLEGRVVAADGSPACGVEVHLVGSNSDRDRLRPGTDPVASFYGTTEERRTDDLGRFRFPDLAAGGYRVTAVPAGGRNVEREVDLAAKIDVRDVELRLAGGDPFTVTVIDTEGSPVSGVTVGLATVDEWSFSRNTGPNGRAAFTPGAKVRSVTTTPWPGGRVYLPAEPVLVADDAKEVRIVIEEAETVTGIVVAPDGRGIGQASIDATCEGKPFVRSPFGPTQIWTDWSGRFSVDAPKGKQIDLVLVGFARAAPTTMAHGGPVLQGEVRSVAAGTKDVVLRATAVPTDRTLSVLVLGPDGSPEAGAEVTAYAWGGSAVRPGVIAGMTGRATLTDLPATRLHVVARVASDNPHRGDWLDASASDVVPTGQQIEVAFTEARRFEGVVLDPEGNAVEGATVAIYRNQRPFSQRLSGKGGRFAVPVPTTDDGTLYVYAWHRPDPGRTWEFRQDRFRAPSEPLTIRLALPAR